MTGKTPWGALMTAVMAVLALILGAMAIAGPAIAKDDNPNKPDDPGNSATAPGQNHTPPGQTNTPPGQEPGDTPGASHDKMTICHFVEGKGETKDGYNIITMSEQAWAAHLAHHPGTLDVVYNGVSCPAVPTPATCPSDAAVHAGEVIPEGQTAETYCVVAPTPATCPSDAAVHAGEVIPEGQTAETYCVVGSDGPTEVTPVEDATVEVPELVAPVEAGTIVEDSEAVESETVAVPQPATVVAPQPATVPAAVPAGDGSSVPQTPAWMLAMLALGTVGLLASATRLVAVRVR